MDLARQLRTKHVTELPLCKPTRVDETSRYVCAMKADGFFSLIHVQDDHGYGHHIIAEMVSRDGYHTIPRIRQRNVDASRIVWLCFDLVRSTRHDTDHMSYPERLHVLKSLPRCTILGQWSRDRTGSPSHEWVTMRGVTMQPRCIRYVIVTGLQECRRLAHVWATEHPVTCEGAVVTRCGIKGIWDTRRLRIKPWYHGVLHVLWRGGNDSMVGVDPCHPIDPRHEINVRHIRGTSSFHATRVHYRIHYGASAAWSGIAESSTPGSTTTTTTAVGL